MLSLYLCRHGHYINKRQVQPMRMPGLPLSPKGKKQSQKLARLLQDKNITAIYSSPITRCAQTAAIIGEYLKIKPQYTKLLTETLSPIQGITLQKFNAVYKDLFNHPYHLENGGETLQQIFNRCMKILNHTLTKHKNQSVLFVSHSDPCLSLIYGLVDKDLAKFHQNTRTYIPKTGLVKFTFQGKKLTYFSQLNYQ